MATAAQDKHKEVRRAAEVALSAIHRHLDSAAVTEVLSSEPPDAQTGLLRTLQVRHGSACFRGHLGKVLTQMQAAGSLYLHKKLACLHVS